MLIPNLHDIEKNIIEIMNHASTKYLTNRTWVKSNNVKEIRCGDSYVLYNSILNSPIILNKDALDYYNSTEEIVFPLNSNAENIDYDELFAESFLFIPIAVSENELVRYKSDDYLEKFSNGMTLDMFDLRISEICNFGCKHCIAGNTTKNTIMEYSQAKAIIDKIVILLANKKSNILRLHYGNAEPTVNYKIIPMIHDYIIKQYPGILLEESINTNISLVTREMAQWFKANNVAVYTSLDGIKKGNDSIRIQKSGKGTYDIIIDKLNMFKEIGYPLKGISVTITESNYDYVKDDFIDWCIGQCFSSVAYDFDLINLVNISIDEATDFLVDTWKKFRANNIEFYGTWATPFLNISNELYTNDVYGFCKAKIGKNLSIDKDGNVFICSFSSKSLCNLDDIEQEMQNGGSFYNYVKSNLLCNNPVCYGCKYEGACIGQCDVTKEYTIQKVKKQCEFYQTVTDKIIRAQVLYENF